jgi:hypothetical protein
MSSAGRLVSLHNGRERGGWWGDVAGTYPLGSLGSISPDLAGYITVCLRIVEFPGLDAIVVRG